VEGVKEAHKELGTRVARMERLEKTLRRLKSKVVVQIDHDLERMEEEESAEGEIVHPSDLDGVFDGVDFEPEFLASVSLAGAGGGSVE
jgi:hypothetical protein